MEIGKTRNHPNDEAFVWIYNTWLKFHAMRSGWLGLCFWVHTVSFERFFIDRFSMFWYMRVIISYSNQLSRDLYWCYVIIAPLLSPLDRGRIGIPLHELKSTAEHMTLSLELTESIMICKPAAGYRPHLREDIQLLLIVYLITLWCNQTSLRVFTIHEKPFLKCILTLIQK